MTRCYEYYLLYERTPERCLLSERGGRYVRRYIGFMKEKGVKFDGQSADKALFYRLFDVHGSEFKVTQRQDLAAPLSPLPAGKYRTLIVDPPWPMTKMLREVRPNQTEELDYPTMSVESIKALPIRAIMADECHVYLWTTQRFLPIAFEVFKAWGIEYECLLTWVKNVGFTPYSWMYSTEHVLFGRVGALELLQKGRRLDFYGKVREHSRKPDEFYALVRDVSPEPRIDLFSREKREGFDQYGNEVDKFTPLIQERVKP